MAEDHPIDTVGKRVRYARKAKGLTIIQLAERLTRSESWMRGVEVGRFELKNHSDIDKLAHVLDVDVSWLLMQPYQPAEPSRDAGHLAVPALRNSIRRTSLILSGHPGISPQSAPELLTDLRADVDRVTRRRQAARLADVMRELPDLSESLNTSAIQTRGTDDQPVVYGLIVETSHVARMVLNQLGYHDLAWIAVENAAFAAEAIGDPLLKACSAWDRCGVLLHTGSLTETITIAEDALNDLEPLMAEPTAEVLSLAGALRLRCAVAFARRSDALSAWEHHRAAKDIAARLGVDRNDFQTMFGPGNVAIHASEIAVELNKPDLALDHHHGADLTGVKSKERHTRHAIDIARAYGQLGKDEAAVHALNDSMELADQYTVNHPMARQLVTDLRRRGKASAVSAGLPRIERAMGMM